MTTTVSSETLQAQVAGSSFYAGMRMLPKAEREAMYAVYAFCRAVDDIADDLGGERSGRAVQLGAWRADIDALYAGNAPGRAVLVADAVRRFGLERQDFHDVIDGMMMDVDRDITWPSAAELDLYCDRVASAVGRLSVRIFGMDRQPGIDLAYHLGRALQLTNILRDIDEDAGIGRFYLPLEAIQQAGIVPTTPATVAADTRIDAVARQVAHTARDHYAKAHAILATRPRGHLIAPRLMDAAYSAVLVRMEAVGWAAPRTRVRVSKLRLLWMIVRLRFSR